MFLKLRVNNIKRNRRLIDALKYDIIKNDGYYTIKITTKSPHNLNGGDVVMFSRDINEFNTYTEASIFLIKNPNEIVYVKENKFVGDVFYERGYYWLNEGRITKPSEYDLSAILKKYNSYEDKFQVLSDDLTQTTFSISYPYFKNYVITEVFDGDMNGYVKIDGKLPFILQKYESFKINKIINCYQYERDEEWNDNIYETDTNPDNSTVFLGFERVKFCGKVYIWKAVFTEIDCNYINDNFLKYSYDTLLNKDDIIVVVDNRFINDGKIGEDVKLYEYVEYIDISLPISSNNMSELNDENIATTYFDEKKKELIPEIADYEKKCFTPFYSGEKALEYVSKIKFNLYFRDRSDSEEWATNDAMGWNQYKLDDSGNFKVVSDRTKGDLLGYLGFTDDDVYYRKNKLSKSFLRLSFYDSNNPLTQMLLYYSTIFIDSNELYSKYVRNINKKKTGSEISLVNDTKLGDDNLTVSFSVSDRYDRTKSSEGFYLYLFPDGIKDGSTRTIYMKAEFNHAGYGKTVPLICPNNKVRLLDFNDDNFPTSLIDEDNVDLKELYRQLYIPITIKYDKKVNDFVYYFHLCEFDSDIITINLYEPKINPLN